MSWTLGTSYEPTVHVLHPDRLLNCCLNLIT
ncbi:hypothetical protein D910_01937 [Dendroctonus ponderosae]|uniref:Uncharacterized protein n=1 Tax=Dendroctonus ponderosae TaxID=77166 RepID=U4TUQ6_DENPD|nr:hypothetical protein D910_01937 [Dendroctonus ponderosae]